MQETISFYLILNWVTPEDCVVLFVEFSCYSDAQCVLSAAPVIRNVAADFPGSKRSAKLKTIFLL